MTGSIPYRILLAALLPVLAVLIYFEGQKYDPALIKFDATPIEAEDLASLLPQKVNEYNRVGQVRSYTKENLYEYVNGHAEYFISAGFKGMSVGEYGQSGKEGSEAEVIVDIYDMGRSIQAFGVVSDESGGSLTDMAGGLTGFTTPSGQSFVKGKYYVKITSFNSEAPLNTISALIARGLGSGSDPFPEFERLPVIGEVRSTRFIREAYRGLDFVNNVIEREYSVNGEDVQVFILPGSAEETERLAGLFTEYFRESDIFFTTSEKDNRRILRISDPYEGDWVLIVLPDTLYGIYGGFDEGMIDALRSEGS